MSYFDLKCMNCSSEHIYGIWADDVSEQAFCLCLDCTAEAEKIFGTFLDNDKVYFYFKRKHIIEYWKYRSLLVQRLRSSSG